MTLPFYDTVAVLRAGTSPAPDGGDPVPNWAAATTASYRGELQPVETAENVVAQQRTLSTHLAYLPANADVKATDRLRHQGRDYEIDGEPEAWRAWGQAHHIEVPCYRVTGG